MVIDLHSPVFGNLIVYPRGGSSHWVDVEGNIAIDSLNLYLRSRVGGIDYRCSGLLQTHAVVRQVESAFVSRHREDWKISVGRSILPKVSVFTSALNNQG